MPVTNKLIIKDEEYKKAINATLKLHGLKIKIGLFGDGKPDKNVAARGAIHELGLETKKGKGIKITPKMRRFLHAIGIHVKADTKFINIPRRSFMKKAFVHNKDMLIKIIEKWYKDVLNNRITVKRFLNRIGVLHTGQIKKTIKDGSFKKLHPVTVIRKGSSKPLIDSSDMLNRVKHKITKKGD